MDEKFDKLINGMFPNQNQYREKILNRELQSRASISLLMEKM